MTSLGVGSPTLFRAAADLVVLVHVAFVVFVVLGGLLVARWPLLAIIHGPAAAWGALIEFRGWICPLTPLEDYLRQLGGSTRYEGDFIDHYVLPLLYPAHLTPSIQIWLGTLAVAVNVVIYWHVFQQTAHKREGSQPRSRGDR